MTGDLESERLVELPRRLETSSWFSPVIVVNTQVALALNAVSLGGNQTATALNLAGTGVVLH